MSDRNASTSAFGWDFQTNSAILLMLENIKNAKQIRVEGADEDIEITLQDNSKIYAQAKSIAKPDDYNHVINKLSDALETLSLAAKNGDGSLFTYVTNSPNPFNNKRTMSYFTGRTHLDYNELPDAAKNKIIDIVHKKGYNNLDLNKFDVRVIPFYGNDLKNRYKEILACINEFLGEINIDITGINTSIMEIWQRDLFQNATQTDTDIFISKEKMIWPLIVLVIDKSTSREYEKDFDEDEIEEIERKYKLIINQNTMSYKMITRVIFDYRGAKKDKKTFISENWRDYQDIVDKLKTDNLTKQSLVKIILYRILTQRRYIKNIKRGANL
ncbi:hypothetical protein [Sharpea azabuensis]|uniref:hypothetical protein n=1 Tax=Sharpea azabuensis TaxID=322505 RepID=UPI00051C6E58|nr:hypothetical protein [Sharpea azabuensis]